MQRLSAAISFVLCAMAFSASNATAQDYPNRTIKIVVPFAAGGALDTVARLIGAKLSEIVKQPVIVENRPGAGGNVGADAVAKSPPDGYTILLSTNGLAISASLYTRLSFDPAKDLIPVTQLSDSGLVLVANPTLPVTSVKELIALAKSKPGKLNYGSSGVGNPLHLSMEMLKKEAGIDIVAVPFKGDAPVHTALIAGQVDVAVVPLGTGRPHIEAGRERALGVTSAKRSFALPNVPTIAESGVPGYESPSWHGLFVAAGTPPAVVGTIQREVAKALADPEVAKRYRNFGSEIVASTPQDFAAKYKADLAKYEKVIAEAKIPKLD
jgi:tripartite-type tricarboxylate transporter receptor subunit TctC